MPRRSSGAVNERRLRLWASFVNGHRAGADDAAASNAAALNASAIYGIYSDLQTAYDRLLQPSDPDKQIQLPGWEGPYRALAAVLGLDATSDMAQELPAFVKRAVLLHTDVAMLDARRRGIEDAAVVLNVSPLHFGFALAATEELHRRVADDAFARRWFEVVAVFLQSTADFGAGPAFAARAVALFPDLWRAHFAGGALNEFLASPRMQSRLGLRYDVRFGSVHFEDERTYLKRAEAFYQRAATQNGLEARLRLAHVVGQGGDHRRALSALKAAQQQVSEPRLRFYLWTFIGDEQKAQGDCGGAGESYRRALALYPGAQSAALRLSHALHACGDKRGAAAAIRNLVAAGAADDPWFDYFRDGPSRLPELYEQLARSAARPPS